MSKIRELIKKAIVDEENRTLLFNIAGNYLVKGGAMMLSILIMPAYMRYFESKAVLGVWFTLVQLLNWIMLLDFGIGGGLRNQIIEPIQKRQKEKVVELVSAAYVFVAVLVLILIVAFQPLINHLNWHSILGISDNEISKTVLQRTVYILVVGVCIRFYTVLICHVLYAMQLAVLPGVLNLTSNVLILLYLLCVKSTTVEADIIKLAYVNSIANNLPALFATIWVFATRLRGMHPRFSAFKLSVARQVMGTGGTLFYLQIVLMLLFNVKEMYISWFVGPEAVVEYQVYYKLIGMIGGLYSLALNPVWSAVTKALVNRKYKWIRGLYKKGIKLIALFGAVQLVLVMIMPWVVRVWLGQKAIEVSRKLALLFCIYNIIYMWMMLNYNFACGMGHTRTIAIWLTIAGITNLLLTMWGCSVYSEWVTVVVSAAIAALPCSLFVRRDIHNAIKDLESIGGTHVRV